MFAAPPATGSGSSMSEAPATDAHPHPSLNADDLDPQDLDPQEVVEDAIEFFGEDDDETPPVGDADAPAPG